MKFTLLLTVASSLAIASAKTCQWTRKSCSPNGGQISMQAWIDHSRELCTRIGGSPQGIYSDQVVCDAPGTFVPRRLPATFDGKSYQCCISCPGDERGSC
ncbi:hypothetical protein CABS01_04736 [Colletotrichum abscissum]|uniref:Uncharacterized protein n=2 Tax=Colletotrichum acutatum species complex TaxID=2707335 RepID=A0A9Q0B0B0_9PEZI|nr:uncharacterized protein CLUP02_15259 [Colletotrichum lupini]XP_060389768.1 uncharacterized protein CABS01_04736 [Colletotrichum abscissum]KAI3540594.1 hypothetical protein CABS02_11007 [Colletotrichum abscissum]KAK1472093.1 hypothetical protein CABS01_04736 [Colletotrichum abscissum]KAK1721015.1 hypothetical protein BDP67DRAFT_614919 [Colletotrichum lupini]UQC89728.1 hypothetical protein CLUP02_15259 [Colletotrichum lupini]